MWMFYNITMGIKDRSVFTPPKFCFQKVNVYFFLGKVNDFSYDTVVMYTFMSNDLEIFMISTGQLQKECRKAWYGFVSTTF